MSRLLAFLTHQLPRDFSLELRQLTSYSRYSSDPLGFFDALSIWVLRDEISSPKDSSRPWHRLRALEIFEFAHDVGNSLVEA